MKGYTVRRIINYQKGINGNWKSRSMSFTENGYTKKFPSIEAAEAFAREKMALPERSNPDTESFIQCCKIYIGKDCIKVIER